MSGPESASVPDATASAAPAPRRPWLWRLLQLPFFLFCRTWIRLQIHGAEHLDPEKGGLLLVNHQSFLDPLLVGVMLNRPVSYLARDSLFRVPVLGWILRTTYVIPISRESARGGSIRTAVERLERGFLVGIFPEGTRTAESDVGRFRPGFLAIARRSSQPVYPVGIAGAAAAMPRGSWFIRPRRIHIVFGPPLPPAEADAIRTSAEDDSLCELARTRVRECVTVALKTLEG